jgi:hypothetical protein
MVSTVDEVIRALVNAEGGPIAYTHASDELLVGNLALSRKPFGYDWPDGKWCVYFRTRRECFDVLLFDNESAASENFLRKVLYNRDLTKRHGNFTRADAKQQLDIAGVDPREYSLNGSDFADQYVLDISDGRWTVSFSERGNRREIAEFDREADAALHLLNRVLVSKERQNRCCLKAEK